MAKYTRKTMENIPDSDIRVIEAVADLRREAVEGDAVAQYVLGTLYRDGIRFPQSYVEAERWFRLAAEQEHTVSQIALGDMYSKGKGVIQNYKEAVKWFRLAAHTSKEKTI